MALAAYFDDSREIWDRHGTGKDHNRLHAIAGYVAPIEAWQGVFEPKWKAMLESAPHPITEYKTSDIRGRRGEFKPYSDAERHTLALEALGIITDPELPVFGCAVIMNGAVYQTDTVTEELERLRLRSCLIDALILMCRYCNDMGRHEPIDFYCDTQNPLEQWLKNTWDEARAGVEPLYGKRLSQLSFGHSHERLPLQAADILAYEARKDVRDRIVRPTSQRSKALTRLLEDKPHAGLYSDIDISKRHQSDPARFTPHAVAFLSPSLSLEGGKGTRPAPVLEDPRPGVPFPGGPAFWKAHGRLP